MPTRMRFLRRLPPTWPRCASIRKAGDLTQVCTQTPELTHVVFKFSLFCTHLIQILLKLFRRT